MSAFSECHYFFVCFRSGEDDLRLVCRKVLRNSLFQSQGESQSRTKLEGSRYTTHTFCIAIALSSNRLKNDP